MATGTGSAPSAHPTTKPIETTDDKLTVNQGNQVRSLPFAAVDFSDDADKLVYDRLIVLPLKPHLKIIPFVAQELATLDGEPNLVRQPTGRRPVLTSLGPVHGRVEQQNIRDALDGLPRRERLVSPTSVAPAPGLLLSLDAGLENLREGAQVTAQGTFERLLLACQINCTSTSVRERNGGPPATA